MIGFEDADHTYEFTDYYKILPSIGKWGGDAPNIKTGKKVKVVAVSARKINKKRQFKVDKKIIGGLIVKVGSKMIDTSLLNKINKLKIAMKGA